MSARTAIGILFGLVFTPFLRSEGLPAELTSRLEKIHIETPLEKIFKAAAQAEKDGNLQVFGFWTGMRIYDAHYLAKHRYSLRPDEWTYWANPRTSEIYSFYFPLGTMQKMARTDGLVVNDFQELAQAVANEAGNMRGMRGAYKRTLLDNSFLWLSDGSGDYPEGCLFSRSPLGADAANAAIEDFLGSFIPEANGLRLVSSNVVSQLLFDRVFGGNPMFRKFGVNMLGGSKPMIVSDYRDAETFLENLLDLPEAKNLNLRFFILPKDAFMKQVKAGKGFHVYATDKHGASSRTKEFQMARQASSSDAPSHSSQSDNSRAIKPEYKNLSKALDAVLNSSSLEAILDLENIWTKVPVSTKEAFDAEIKKIICAGFLARGNVLAFKKRKGQIDDYSSFWEAVSEQCPKCNGKGKKPSIKDPTKETECYHCSGDGRIADQKKCFSQMELIIQKLQDAFSE